MLQTATSRSTFGSSDVEKVHAVVARSSFRRQSPKTLHVRATFERWSVALCGRRKGFCTLPKVSKSWRLKSTQLQIQLQLRYITQHYATLITLHYATTTTATAAATTTSTTLHYVTLRYTTLHYTTLHYTPLHYTTLHCYRWFIDVHW